MIVDSIKNLPSRSSKWFWALKDADSSSLLRKLSSQLERETQLRLAELSKDVGPPQMAEGLYLSINNLTNTFSAVNQLLRSRAWIGAEKALAVIEEQITSTRTVLSSHSVSSFQPASEIAVRTLNLLFVAGQEVKRTFFVRTPFMSRIETDVIPQLPAPTAIAIGATSRKMVLPSSFLYELHYSLFPPERMIVAAGRRTGESVSIEAVFDVTGEASAGGVKAHPDRLARALIAMAETGTYFAFWVHSHPSTGPEFTRPSSIDIRQHADWLRDFSPNLVSAILVKDRYIRFWGTAVDTGKIAVEVEGPGVAIVSQAENIYRLEV